MGNAFGLLKTSCRILIAADPPGVDGACRRSRRNGLGVGLRFRIDAAVATISTVSSVTASTQIVTNYGDSVIEACAAFVSPNYTGANLAPLASTDSDVKWLSSEPFLHLIHTVQFIVSRDLAHNFVRFIPALP